MQENMKRAARLLSPFLFGALALAGTGRADQPPTRDHLLSVARASRDRKQFDAAIADLTVVIITNPHDARFYAERAACCRAKGDEASAAKDFDRAHRLGWVEQKVTPAKAA